MVCQYELLLGVMKACGFAFFFWRFRCEGNDSTKQALRGFMMSRITPNHQPKTPTRHSSKGSSSAVLSRSRSALAGDLLNDFPRAELYSVAFT